MATPTGPRTAPLRLAPTRVTSGTTTADRRPQPRTGCLGPPPFPSRRRAFFSELFGQLRDDLEQVADEADVGDLEDRRFLVLVDRDDRLRILHSGEVLDGARDADRDIDFGGDDLAGLPDLIVVGGVAGIDR